MPTLAGGGTTFMTAGSVDLIAASTLETHLTKNKQVGETGQARGRKV